VKIPFDTDNILDRYLTSEECLIVALIENAILDATNNGIKKKNNREIRNEAKRWINSESIDPFSFKWCLSILNLEDFDKKNIIKTILEYRANLNLNKKEDYYGRETTK